LKEAVELTELLGQAKNEDQDCKGLIEQLMSTLDGVKAAAGEAHTIPLPGTDESVDLIRMMVQSISRIYEHYKDMQELLPTLT